MILSTWRSKGSNFNQHSTRVANCISLKMKEKYALKKNITERIFYSWRLTNSPKDCNLCNTHQQSFFMSTFGGSLCYVHTMILVNVLINFEMTVCSLQWLPLESLQGLFYEAKLSFSERSITIWKCHHATELLRHSYHTLALSKEVYNFVFA